MVLWTTRTSGMDTLDLEASNGMRTASTKLTPRVALALLYTLVLALGVALGGRIIVDGYSPVPHSDLWGLFPFIERGLRGDFGLSDLWAQWNEHRFFLARIQFLVDYRFFEGTNIYLFVSIATACLLLAGTFAAAVWFDARLAPHSGHPRRGRNIGAASGRSREPHLGRPGAVRPGVSPGDNLDSQRRDGHAQHRGVRFGGGELRAL